MPDPRIFPINSSVISYASIGAISILIMAANTRRGDAYFTNDSTCVVYLARGEDAVVGSGIRLNPNGGTWEIHTWNMWYGEVYAISEGQKCNITMMEGQPKA